MDIAKSARRTGGESAYEVLALANELEREGKSIVHMEIGQPDFKTPGHIVASAVQALKSGKTRYTATLGTPELRAVIARTVSRTHQVKVAPDQVAVTPSAKTALLLSMAALIDQGDEVIYPNPGFPAYENLINFLGGKPKPLPLLESKNFSFDITALQRLITSKTKLIILNSPSNPTGSIISQKDLLALSHYVKKHKKLFVLTDEIYSNILYDGSKFPSFYEIPGMHERTFLVDGFSKSFSMTGWRLGYLVAPKSFMKALDNLAVNFFGCTAHFSQYAGVAALTKGDRDMQAMVREFEKRRDVLVAGLNAIPGISCRKPDGAFYVFPNIKKFGMTSEKLALALLEEAGVAVLAGTAFGRYGEGYLRISYATSLANIREALRRIALYAEKHFA